MIFMLEHDTTKKKQTSVICIKDFTDILRCYFTLIGCRYGVQWYGVWACLEPGALWVSMGSHFFASLPPLGRHKSHVLLEIYRSLGDTEATFSWDFFVCWRKGPRFVILSGWATQGHIFFESLSLRHKGHV